MVEMEGSKAPDFKVQDESGTLRSLSNYRGKILLLYFYPKDMTPGCTIEAKAFRDKMNELKGAGISVLGVSTDSKESHKKFIEMHKLNFPLLSDVDKDMVRAYNVWERKKVFGKEIETTKRESFLIDKEGIIRKHYSVVVPYTHPYKVLVDAKEIGL